MEFRLSTKDEIRWSSIDPYDVLLEFHEKHVTDNFSEDDAAGPARSDIVVELTRAIRLSLDSVLIIDPPEKMSEMLQQLLATGLYGTRESEVLERLAAERLAQMVDDDSPLLSQAQAKK